MDKIALMQNTASMAAAFFKNNTVPLSEVTNVIEQIAQSLQTATLVGAAVAAAPVMQEPAVPIRKSVHNDYVICLEDGAKMKSLKRYLMRKFNLTPDQYRAKWGLPKDYPIVAPAYAAKRSELAKLSGLGRKRTETPVVETETPAPVEPEVEVDVAPVADQAPASDFQDEAEVSTAKAPNMEDFTGTLPEGYTGIGDTFAKTDDGARLICLIDGKMVRDLGRHARKHHNVSAEQYRKMFGLPADYPMTAERIEAYLAKAA